MKKAQGSSYGKVIISGEHSVVYGYPALVASAGKKLTVTLTEGAENNSKQSSVISHIKSIFSEKFSVNTENVAAKIESQIPSKSGMGSSAALASAFFKALFGYFDLEYDSSQLLELVQASEQFAHGKASGVDTVAIVEGGVLRFQRNESGYKVEHIDPLFLSELNFSLISSGRPDETTKQMVSQVADSLEENKQTQELLAEIGEVTEIIISDLKNKNFQPELIARNQKLLIDLRIVGKRAISITKKIKMAGGVVKVTGAGGVKSGSGMMLAYHPKKEILQNLIRDNDWDGFEIHLGEGGSL